jgi:hypothetical protein
MQIYHHLTHILVRILNQLYILMAAQIYVEAWGYTSHSSGTGIWGYVNNTTRMDGFLIKRTS